MNYHEVGRNKIMEKIQKLTKREQEVLYLIAEGMSNPEIAKSLGITIHTVKAHIENIFYKLDVHNKVQAAVFAAINKFI